MPARFTKGQSIESTRNIADQNRTAKEPRTRSHVLRAGNTASGLPGYINAHQSEAMDGAKGGKPVGPRFVKGESLESTRKTTQLNKSPSEIGRRGPVGPRSNGGFGPVSLKVGTQVKSYRAVSTGRAGTIKSNEHTGAHHVHTHNVSKGHPGRMESLRGRAKMSSER